MNRYKTAAYSKGFSTHVYVNPHNILSVMRVTNDPVNGEYTRIAMIGGMFVDVDEDESVVAKDVADALAALEVES